MVKISVLGVMAFLIMFIEFPLPIFPSFLKIDISDLPALIGAFAFGPIEGVLVELVKNILHLIIKNGTGGVGELANFMIGSVLVYVSGYIYKYKKTKKRAFVSLIVGAIVMSLAAGVLNYSIFLPLFEKVVGFPIQAMVGIASKINPQVKDLNTYIIWAIIPFNLIKGVIVSFITLLVYKSISPVLNKENMTIENSIRKLS